MGVVGVGAGGDPVLEEVGGLRVGDGAVVEEGAGEGGFGVQRVRCTCRGPILLLKLGEVGVDLKEGAGIDQSAEMTVDRRRGVHGQSTRRQRR